MIMYIIPLGVIIGIIWYFIGWNIYHAPTDVELWDEEIE